MSELRKTVKALSAVLVGAALCATLRGQTPQRVDSGNESTAARDERMAWWREARFGMFIHWGLYAIPAGERNGKTDYGEWIRHSGQVPIAEYEKYVGQFNPVKFNADAWVRLAREAGMKYIVITSKHHDGFCLFDSQFTDFDIMATPLGRDVLKDLAAACQRGGIKLCFYHSIMDWHHPDYLPRRDWVAGVRPAAEADFDRYVAYMKNQLRELLTNYGPIGVLWFDGEWESTWTEERGVDLYRYVRGLQPAIIINNRVGAGRGGMGGMTSAGQFGGDFNTPEQEIPATGLPGVVWETCMTMNDHWGWNQRDKNFKSGVDLIRKLVDIASKGGNFLLNVGPTAEGEIPPESVERLREIGAWMDVNGEAIHGTQASPFAALPWGRCTQKRLAGGDTRLYLCVFDWPADGRLRVPGLLNEAKTARVLGAGDWGRVADVRRDGAAVVLHTLKPEWKRGAACTVIELDVAGAAEVGNPPAISAGRPIFTDELAVTIKTDQPRVEVRYTINGREPSADSPLVEDVVRLRETATVQARTFRSGRVTSETGSATFTKVTPRRADGRTDARAGLVYEYYEGAWDKLPAFDSLPAVRTGVVADFTIAPRKHEEHFAFRYRGYVDAPRDGVYTFFTKSDDGSALFISDTQVVENDGPHTARERSGAVALGKGLHAIGVTYFERTGDDLLEVRWEGPGVAKQRIPAAALRRAPRAEDDVKEGALARPTPAQTAWQALELTAFVHFGTNTFTDREWGDGTADPSVFNPTAFDARQWARAFKAGGFKQLLLTCKHHDGFCLWPSKYTTYSVASSPWRGGKGDVVREVAEACRAEGLGFGVYLSPWDRHEPSYGDSEKYNEYFKNQLTELLTQYGPIEEVWFDGACGEGPNGKRQVYDWDGYVALIRRLAPNAVIFSDSGPDVRWVGNESGDAGETCWATIHRADFHPGTANYKPLTEGVEDGPDWVPPECDVSIRPGWFYHASEDEKVKRVAELVDIYYKSVGRNAVLRLNVPPDRRGLLHETDVARLAGFHAALEETFGENLVRGAAPTVKEQSVGRASLPAPPGEEAGRDARPTGSTQWVFTIALSRAEAFDRVALEEDIRQGQRVRAFRAEARVDGTWRDVATGTTIGCKRLLRTAQTYADAVRLVVIDARAAPVIAEIGVYLSSPREQGLSADSRRSDEQVERRVETALRQMTLEEKLDYIGGYNEFYIRAIPRLGLPELVMSDGPVGVRNFGPTTAYPAGICLAAAWNTSLAGRFGASIGRDARARGVHIWLGPGVNLARQPQCGRNFEYFGEDPYLASLTAVNVIRAVQRAGVACTVKHFAGNEQEYDRNTVSTQADERTLREVYLRPFEAAVRQGGVWAVMTSYNLVNGVHCSEHEWLIRDVLKGDWGFRGLVMSDWGSVYSAAGPAQAGLDLEMPSGKFMNRENLLPLIREGQLAESVIDDKVRRILRLAYSMGFCDRPQKDESIPRIDPTSEATALQIAREGIVLLKNERGALPLDAEKVRRIVILGPNADPAVTGGGGSSYTTPTRAKSLLDVLPELAGPGVKLEYLRVFDGLAQQAFGFSGYEQGGQRGAGLRAEYFANAKLEGAPALTRVEERIEHVWGQAAPAEGLPADYFSVRWTGTLRAADGGRHLLVARSDDGLRAFWDGQIIIDMWRGQSAATNTALVDLQAGRAYELKVEYFENGGEAVAQFGVVSVDELVNQARPPASVASADALIACVGFNPELEGEGLDRPFGLPVEQQILLESFLRQNPRTIVVLNSGAGVDLEGWGDSAAAIVAAWYPGQMGNIALAEVLFGKTNPSGKLPVTFERRFEDSYAAKGYPPEKDGKLEYGEGVLIGHRYYDAQGISPRFCFGHGLSYTTFAYSDLDVRLEAGQVKVSASVTNTGARPGAETAQLYVGAPECGVPRPVRKLKGFAKLALAAGERRTVEFALDREALAYYDIQRHGWVPARGKYDVFVGPSSRELPLRGEFSWSE